jgi:predicted nucleotidyltransferase
MVELTPAPSTDPRQTIAGIWPALVALGVEHLDLFGSRARGTESPDSDYDFLVYFREPATLSALVAVRDLLAEVLGGHVDVITLGSLAQRPRLRERVLREAIRVA